MNDPNDISTALLADFDPAHIELKDGQRFIGHERIRLRLIEATGNQFDWRIDNVEYRDDGAIRERQDKRTGEVHTPLTCVVYGTLTIPGLGSRSDTGVQVIQHGSGEDSAYKGAVSDCLKRCAMNFGVGLKQLYLGENVAPQQMTERTTSPRPQALQQDQKNTNVREEMSDADFDEAVRDAIASRKGTQYQALVRGAGKYTSRWLILIRHAETEAALAWIEGAIPDGMKSTLLEDEIAKQRKAITV